MLSAYDAYREHRGVLSSPSCSIPRKTHRLFCLESACTRAFPGSARAVLGILAERPLQGCQRCRSCSAIGLLYQTGYFTQTIDGHGHQQVSRAPAPEPHDLPGGVPALTENGEHPPWISSSRRVLKVWVWTVQAGTSPVPAGYQPRPRTSSGPRHPPVVRRRRDAPAAGTGAGGGRGRALRAPGLQAHGGTSTAVRS